MKAKLDTIIWEIMKRYYLAIKIEIITIVRI